MVSARVAAIMTMLIETEKLTANRVAVFFHLVWRELLG
jgi:hypothetical protein